MTPSPRAAAASLRTLPERGSSGKSSPFANQQALSHSHSTFRPGTEDSSDDSTHGAGLYSGTVHGQNAVGSFNPPPITPFVPPTVVAAALEGGAAAALPGAAAPVLRVSLGPHLQQPPRAAAASISVPSQPLSSAHGTLASSSQPTIQRTSSIGPYRKLPQARTAPNAPTLSNSASKRHSKEQLSTMGVEVDKWVIMPFEQRYMVWWFITIAACYVTAFYVPLMFGFSSIPATMPWNTTAAFISWLLLIIFAIDTVLNSCVAYYDADLQVLVTDIRLIRRRYFKFMLWVDLLALIPFDVIVAAACGVLRSDNSLALYIALLKWLNMIRLYRMFGFFSYLQTNMSVSHMLVTLFRNGSYTSIIVHWGACFFYWIARQEMFSEASWVGQNSSWVETQSVTGRYVFSVYWSMTTIATVGYGDIHAYTVPEAAFITCFMFLNIFLFAYVLGTMTLMVVKGDEQTKMYREGMFNLMRYTNRNDIPKELKSSMREHLELHFANSDAAGDESVLAVYPSTVRRRILRHLYLRQLRECYLFSGCKPKFLDALLAAARVEVFMPKVEILAEGDHVNELFIIVSGRAVAQSRSGRLAMAEDITIRGESVRTSGTTGFRRALSPQASQTMLLPLSSNDASLHGGGMNSSVHLGAAHGIRQLGEGDSFGDVAFFTEVNSLEAVRSVNVVRLLVITRAAYEGLAADFPLGARLVLDNLQHASEESLLAEFSGQTQSGQALLKDEDTLEQLYKMAYTWGGQEGADSACSTGLGLSRSQQLALGDLLRIRNVVASYVTRMDHMRTNEWLHAATLGDCDRVRQMMMQGHRIDAADYDDRTALMLAAAKGHKTMVKLLMEAGADANLRDAIGQTAMLEACKHGHDEVLDMLLQAGAGINIAVSLMAGHLCNAVSDGDTRLLSRLLRAGAPPDSCDYDQRTALHIAASEGSLCCVQILHEHHATINVRDRWANSPLDDARRMAAQIVVQYLENLLTEEERDAALKKYIGQRASTFLQAVSDCDAPKVRALLEQSCPPDVADYEDRTGLLIAAAKGRKDIVVMLLMWGADPQRAGRANSSALLEACLAGHDDIVDLLLTKKAALNLTPSDAAGRLCTAVHDKDMSLLVRLLRSGLRPDAGDYDSRTALHVAAVEGNVEALKAMLQVEGVDACCPDRWGASPLDDALRVHAKTAVEFLEARVGELERARSNTKFLVARTNAFLQAASTRDVSTLRTMLERGCPADTADYDKRTGLMLAASLGHTDTAHLLLQWGADPSAQDNLGGSALLEACRAGHDELLEGLLRRGGRVMVDTAGAAARLCNAVSQKETALLRRLLVAGLNANACDYDARTALHVAASENDLEAFQVLVERGADLLARDRWGNTPLDDARRVGGDQIVAYVDAREAAGPGGAGRAGRSPPRGGS